MKLYVFYFILFSWMPTNYLSILISIPRINFDDRTTKEAPYMGKGELAKDAGKPLIRWLTLPPIHDSLVRTVGFHKPMFSKLDCRAALRNLASRV